MAIREIDVDLWSDEVLVDPYPMFHVNDRVWRRNNALHGLERCLVTVSGAGVAS